MGNVSKRQQPDHRADNSRRLPIGLQCSEKIPKKCIFSKTSKEFLIPQNNVNSTLFICFITKHNNKFLDSSYRTNKKHRKITCRALLQTDNVFISHSV